MQKDPKSSLWNSREGIHGLAQADFIDARFLAQGPIGNTGWKFAVGGRRSYADVWLKPVLDALDSGVTSAPVYYDYQAMVQRSWDKGRHNLRFFLFGSDDRFEALIRQVAGNSPGLTGNIGLGTAFYRFQARYTGKLSDDTELRALTAIGKDAIELNVGDNHIRLDSVQISGRVELSQKIGVGARNNVGIDMLSQPYTVDLRAPPIPRPGEPPAGPFGSRPPLVFRG